ncbi:glycosyltransferase [Flavobacterium sp.]|uniref:glycosyltransferase n=1 Tax=Flavobacterium sp. TaxID=239 RepID=UPI00286BD7D7|nr:glycosyltransferase [Flavobacterium sp.]
MQKNILVAPLNWGLGHATRCIPIIKALEENNFTPIIASDGDALTMLRKEFPHLKSLELPSYEIEYAKDGADFKWKMLKNMPKMMDAIREEKKTVKQWVKEYNLVGIISDNRLGVFSKKVHAVFITHQLNVLTGNTTWITSKLHQHIIKKFDECWVPDYEDTPNLTGKLGHLKTPIDHIKYIGPLSRLEKKEVPIKYDLMVILSGPEPQRSILEHRLRDMIDDFEGNVVFICGKMALQQSKIEIDHVTFYNFMTTSQLEQTFNESKMVLCRSGYTTVMDLAKLEKKAFFIPTPGQYEQEYLAKRLKKNGLFPYSKQEDFSFDKLLEMDLYKNAALKNEPIHWKNLLCLFERKGEF